MPLSSSDPIVSAYANSTARRVTGAAPSSGTARGVFASSPYSATPVGPATATRIPGQLPGETTSGGVASPSAPAAPGGTAPSSTSGEWTFDGITDPSWFGVARGYQYSADTINSNAGLKRQQIQTRADFQRPQIQYEGEIARRDTSYDAEGRGILRSGETERNLAEQMRKEQQRLSDLDLQTSEGLGGVEMDLGTQMSDLRRQFTEKGQEAAYQQYLNQGLQAAQTGAPDPNQPAAGVNGGMSLAKNPDGSNANGGLYFDGWAYYTMNNGIIKHIGDPATVSAMMAAGSQPVPVQGDQIAYYRKAVGLA